MNSKKAGKGKLFVISGPSGVGKGTIAKKLLERDSEIIWSISSTNRQPRQGEIDGKDYFFLSTEEFQKKNEQGLFLEWAEIHGLLYGTRKDFLEKLLNEGKKVLLEIDVQGAANIKKSDLPCILIFLTPPSIEVLLERLKGRNSETEETLATRLKTTEKELEQKVIYDYIIVNKTVSKTVEKIGKIIKKNWEE